MSDCECRNCTDRYVGCHSSCERYKKFRDDLDSSIQQKRDMVKSMYGEYYMFKRDQIFKETKRSRHRR